MIKEIWNQERNNGAGGWEVTYPANIISLNTTTKIAREGSDKQFYRGMVIIKDADGEGAQKVAANCNVGAFDVNPDAFETGAEIGFTIATREAGENAGRGGWMSFAKAPAFDFTLAGGFEKGVEQPATTQASASSEVA